MTWKRPLWLGLILASSVPSCTDAEREAAKPGPAVETYESRGMVRGVNFAAGTVTIEHEAIPGFMPAMTMPFAVKDADDLHRLTADKAIWFELKIEDDRSWITAIEPIDSDTLDLPQAGVRKGSDVSVARVREGDPAPPFELIDQTGELVALSDFRGHDLVLTFIFTRCPVPEYCPRMSKHFGRLQEKIGSDPALAERTRLLSVTIDPEYDTPEILATYASRFGALPEIWRFATGPAEAIAKLAKSFAVYVKPEAGSIDHGLCTVHIDGEGIVRSIWRGNRWSPSEVLASLRPDEASRSDTSAPSRTSSARVIERNQENL